MNYVSEIMQLPELYTQLAETQKAIIDARDIETIVTLEEKRINLQAEITRREQKAIEVAKAKLQIAKDGDEHTARMYRNMVAGSMTFLKEARQNAEAYIVEGVVIDNEYRPTKTDEQYYHDGTLVARWQHHNDYIVDLGIVEIEDYDADDNEITVKKYRVETDDVTEDFDTLSEAYVYYTRTIVDYSYAQELHQDE